MTGSTSAENNTRISRIRLYWWCCCNNIDHVQDFTSRFFSPSTSFQGSIGFTISMWCSRHCKRVGWRLYIEICVKVFCWQRLHLVEKCKRARGNRIERQSIQRIRLNEALNLISKSITEDRSEKKKRKASQYSFFSKSH